MGEELWNEWMSAHVLDGLLLLLMWVDDAVAVDCTPAFSSSIQELSTPESVLVHC